MPDFDSNMKVIKELEQYLKTKELVVLVDPAGAGLMAEMLCSPETLANAKKNIVVITASDNYSKVDGNIYHKVTDAEMELLLELYRSYEVSDKVMLLSNNSNYGNAWNYVKNGILTPEEMFAAFFD